MARVELGERIASLREEQALTQADLAERARISPSTLSQIESGKVPRPHVGTVRKIARALGIEPQDLRKAEEPALAGKAEAPSTAGPSPEEQWSPRVKQWLKKHGATRVLMPDEEVVKNFERLASGSNRQAIPERFEREWHNAVKEEDAIRAALTKEWVDNGDLYQEAADGLRGFERASARMKEYTRLKREISRHYGRYRRGLEAFSKSVFYSGMADDFIFSSRSPQTAEAVRKAVREMQREAFENERGA